MFKKITAILLAVLLISQILIPTIVVAGDSEAGQTANSESRYTVTVVNGGDWAGIMVLNENGQWVEAGSWDFAPGETLRVRGIQGLGHVWLQVDATPAVTFIDHETFIMPAHDVDLHVMHIVGASVTVQGGTINGVTSGVFESRTDATLVADTPPAGYQFSHWSSNFSDWASNDLTFVIADDTAPTTTVMVPSFGGAFNDFTITANFVPIDSGQQRQFTAFIRFGGYFQWAMDANGLHNMVRNAHFYPGEIVRLNHHPETDAFGALRFSHWETTPAVEFISTNEFIMPAYHVEITAVLTNTVDIEIEGGTFVEGGNRLNSVSVGTRVEITANAPQPGYTFSHWEANLRDGRWVPINFENPRSSTTNFPAPDFFRSLGDLIITAVFIPIEDGFGNDNNDPISTYTVTAIGAEILIDDMPYETSRDFSPGDIVTLRSLPTIGWTVFSHWVMNSEVELSSDDLGNTVSFVMPANDVEARAVFISRVLLDVRDGTITNEKPSGLYGMGSTVEIIANEREGYRFSHWVVGPGSTIASVDFVDATASSTTFTIPHLDSEYASITIVAIFEADTQDPTEPPTEPTKPTEPTIPADPTEPTEPTEETVVLTQPTTPESSTPPSRPNVIAVIRETIAFLRTRLNRFS